ncbi:MAG: phosphonate ABC transporter, permease protein PhnE [Janthinobacterium lividum]
MTVPIPRSIAAELLARTTSSTALPPHAHRARGLALGGTAALVYVAGVVALGVSPADLWRGIGQLGTLFVLMVPPTSGTHLVLYLVALGQTLSIALLGTLGAAVLAAPLSFLAARNVVASRVLYLLTRRSLDTLRSVDTLIWALIWIDVVGLGPFAGALAIASSDSFALAKLMSEAIEAADRRPIEGVRASSGGRLAAIRFGIVPQVLPIFASQILYFFESNIRSATIIGIVGAGGIGLHLYEQIRVLEWQQASFLVLMVLVTVSVIDLLSRRLRTAIIGRCAG